MPVSATDAARESRRDPLISEIMNYVEHDSWPHKVSANLQPFSTRRHELSVQQGCLLWGHRLIIPAKLRKDILSSLHTISLVLSVSIDSPTYTRYILNSWTDDAGTRTPY